MTHGLSAGWSSNVWSIVGRYGYRALDDARARATAVDNQSLSVTRGRDRELTGDFWWGRTRNRGHGPDRVSNDLGLGVRWRAAPAMELQQRVTAGRLSYSTTGGRPANSLTVMTSLDASPYSRLQVNLARTNRWVSRQAGPGYTSFNDTNLSVSWRPVLLILVESDVSYQMRGSENWVTRNAVTWTPLEGGRVKFSLGASHYRETRNATTQRTGGVAVDFEASPRLTIQGSVDAVVLTQMGLENRPVNVQVNGNWRF